MDVSSLQSKVKASAVPFDQLAGNPNVSDSDKVKEASRQFEAVLLRQILGEARKTVITSSATKDSNESGIYNDMINNQMAESMSRSGAFGLAKSIETQLVHQVLPKAHHSTQH
ncbi:MAG TPA: rod-binding protein [Candidatus Saccharimonadales bacterium]|nr:rod-binding protein [Candidatus Saccharimonadales bacterium]